jgi:hypothetical protein
MLEAFVKLRDRVFQKQKHIVFDVRVGVFVDRQTARRMLREQNADAFFRMGFAEELFHFLRNFDHFLALARFNLDCLHRKISPQRRQEHKERLTDESVAGREK